MIEFYCTDQSDPFLSLQRTLLAHCKKKFSNPTQYLSKVSDSKCHVLSPPPNRITNNKVTQISMIEIYCIEQSSVEFLSEDYKIYNPHNFIGLRVINFIILSHC
jgi:hypothetical protein